MFEDLENIMKSFSERNIAILAKFYEAFGKIKNSLEVWKTFGSKFQDANDFQESTDSKLIEACEETVRVLGGQF